MTTRIVEAKIVYNGDKCDSECPFLGESAGEDYCKRFFFSKTRYANGERCQECKDEDTKGGDPNGMQD